MSGEHIGIDKSSTLPASSRLHGLSQAAIHAVIATAQALERGRVGDAERQIAGLLALHPRHPEVLRLLAGTQSLRGDPAAAVETMQRAIALRPGDALYYNTLATAQLALGEYDLALANLRHACELDPRLASAWYNRGLTLVRSMRTAEAADALRHALALAPELVDARCMLADQLKAGGQVEQAIAEYRGILARHPGSGMAWWGLADIKTVALAEADIASIERALDRTDVGDDDRVALGFALARAFDDHDRHADSLAVLGRANAVARARRRWSAAAHTAFVDATLDAFDRASTHAAPALGAEAIFIAGLPRSGSSLIEQVLASHSRVDGAGELPDLPLVLTEESRRRGMAFPQWVPQMQAADWQRLGERYLQRTAHWRERRPHFTDKLPGNWLYVGAIRAMLPGARIVICRRDPLETCLSCYRQYLVDNEYSRSFDDLAAFWRDFDRAARHWLHLHPQHVHEHVHEALVADPTTQIRALLQFCGLEFEPDCLEFHRTERAVHTPSAAQVRQPLRRDTARAALYGSLLDPLRAGLGLPLFTPAVG